MSFVCFGHLEFFFKNQRNVEKMAKSQDYFRPAEKKSGQKHVFCPFWKLRNFFLKIRKNVQNSEKIYQILKKIYKILKNNSVKTKIIL